MSAPKVSIIMSVYNGQDHLKECIDSIVNQTFRNFEFIIIDDGSSDKTSDILKEYNDSRVRVFSQENLGLTKSLNRAIGFSIGNYIARIDADEIAVPDRLANQVKFLDSHSDVGLVGSYYVNITNDEKIINKIETPVSDKDIRKCLQKANAIGHGTVMIRKEVFDKVGLYNEEFKYVQDYELWGRVCKSYKMHNIPIFLLKRIITGDTLSSDRGIMKERSLYSLKAHISTLRNLNKPFYCYFYLWPSILIYLAYHLKVLRSPIKQKSSILEIIMNR